MCWIRCLAALSKILSQRYMMTKGSIMRRLRSCRRLLMSRRQCKMGDDCIGNTIDLSAWDAARGRSDCTDCTWAVPSIAGMKIGYRWRKMLWLILAVRLLIPLRFLMSGIYEKKPSCFWQIELSLESVADAPQDDVTVKKQEAIGKAKNDALVEPLESSENTKRDININKSQQAEKAKNDALVEPLESAENTKQDTDIKGTRME